MGSSCQSATIEVERCRSKAAKGGVRLRISQKKIHKKQNSVEFTQDDLCMLTARLRLTTFKTFFLRVTFGANIVSSKLISQQMKSQNVTNKPKNA